MYINEKIKNGKDNNIKNIKGPLRDIYLNKSKHHKKKVDKLAKKRKKFDVWSIMEKEVLIHKLNKINEFIENNNNNQNL